MDVVLVMTIGGKQYLCGASDVAGTILSILNVFLNPLRVL